MTWVPVAVLAYASMAFSQVMDKVLLDRFIKSSSVYATFIGLAGVILAVLFPWAEPMPSSLMIAVSLVGGALFVLALLPFLAALQMDEATRIIPVTGAVIPVLTVVLEDKLLGLQLGRLALLGIACLVVGGVMFTLSHKKGQRRSWKALALAALASLMFATSFVISKYAYIEAPFLSAFLWMRVGGGIAGLVLVFTSRLAREEIWLLFSPQKRRLLGFYTANQALAAVGFALQSYAINLATAGLVTAMQGVQYVFILLFVLAFSRYYPSLLQEKITRYMLIEKITATAWLIAGLALVSI